MTVVMRPLVRVVVASLLGVAWLLGAGSVGGGPAATAHSQLLRSTPADGSVVTAVPASVDLEFNEDITPLNAQVLLQDSSGSLPEQTPRVSGTRVSVAVPPALTAGSVTVRYRVTSKDGHPITGKITFRYDAPQASPSGTPTGPAGARTTETPATATSGSAASSSAVAANASNGSTGSGGTTWSTGWLYGLAGVIAVALITGGGMVLRRETLAGRGL